MKFSELKQAMDWRRRVGFNGGGYVKKKVLPQPKPKEEAEKVNKARKEKTFEKAKPALENPKEVKEMIDKPKRGLVDEPGSYAGAPKGNTIVKSLSKKAQKERSAKISEAMKGKKRPRKSLIDQGIYTIKELSKLQNQPFSYTVLQDGIVLKKRRIMDGLKAAGIEILPKTKGDKAIRLKIVDPNKSINKLVNYAAKLPSPPKSIRQPFIDEIPKVFDELVKEGRPFSQADVIRKVSSNLKDNPYKPTLKDLENIVRSNITKAQKKKLTSGYILNALEQTASKRTIFEQLLAGNTNIKQLAESSELPQKEVKKIVRNIPINIYQARKNIGLQKDIKDVVLKDYNLNDYKKVLDAIRDEPTLNLDYRQGIKDAIFDAYGDPNSKTYSKKNYERALKRVDAFFKVRDKINEAFPDGRFNLQLDHPLSEGALRNLENVTPDQLVRVSPLTKELNVGLKKSFDVKYQNILKDLKGEAGRKGLLETDRKKLIKQKARIELLAKDLDIPLGKVSLTGKPVKFGTQEIVKKNFAKEITEGLKIKDKIVDNIKKIPNLTERVQEVFGKRAKVLELLQNLEKSENLQDVLKFVKPFLRLKGLRADASGVIDQISNAVFTPLQAAEVLPSEAQAAPPKPKEPMSFDLDMSLPTPTKKDITAETTAALTPLVMKYGPSVAKGLGNIFNRLGTPLFQAAYAAVDPASLMFSAPFTQASNVPSGVYKQPKGIMQKISRSANRLFLPRNIAPRVIQGLSRASTFGFPVFKAGEELFKTRGRIRDFERRMTPMERNNPENFQMTAAGKAPKELVRQFMRELPQDAFEYTGAAGGGLLKQAGDRSGKPPEAGPTPQGLDFLMKRGR
jgi:hypothetical protein